MVGGCANAQTSAQRRIFDVSLLFSTTYRNAHSANSKKRIGVPLHTYRGRDFAHSGIVNA